MSGYRHTGVGAALARTDYADGGTVQDSTFIWGGTAGGTADALTIALSPAITAYVVGQHFRCISGASASTTTAPTIAINGLSAKTFKRRDGSACVAGDIPIGTEIEFVYNGTNMLLLQAGAIGSSAIIGPASGGTGIANNAASTITISGNYATTITLTGATGITLPTTGTLATLAGAESLSNKTLVAPILGTPASGTLTNCTGLPVSTGISGLAANVATFLATPSSANLAAAVTDETGSGALVFGTAPAIAGGTHTALTGLGIRSTGAAFDLTMATSEVLTAGRTLSWVMGDAARSITLAGNLSYAGAFTTSGAYAVTLTATGATGITLPTTGTLAILGANTFTGTQVLGDNQITRAMMIDCGWTYLDKGNSGTSTQTLDYTAGQHQKITVTGNFTIASSNWPPTGNLGELLLELVNGATQTITWPTINWIKPDGSTTTSIATYLAANTGRTALQTSGTDFILLWARDAGTTIYGKLV